MFGYVPGSASPGYSGLADIGANVRLGADGTFRADDIPPLYESAPVTIASMALPRDGVTVDSPLLDGWEFTLGGVIRVDDPADLQAAVDYLLDNVNVGSGWLTLTLNAMGWAATRQMTVRVNGQVSAPPPDRHDERRTIATRTFTVPVIAADPRKYAATLQSQVVTTGTDLTNAGNYPAGFTVVFAGATTGSPVLAGPSGSIGLSRALASGETVTVNTDDQGVTTAVDQTGADVFDLIDVDDVDPIPPGTSSWSATGGGTTTVEFRDTWA